MRTFIAVEITDQGLLNSLKKIQTEFEINAKPVGLQNLHFTMFFLGEISDSMSKKIQSILKNVEFLPFNVNFTSIGAFPKPKFPRIIWVGVDKKGEEQLVDLAQQVQKSLLPLGFKPDKPFKPHVTIFRIKNKIDDISDKLLQIKSSFGLQRVSEIKFKKSVLTPDGPIYSDIMVVKAKQ